MDTVKIDRKNVKIIAHRGVSKLERENTCAAFVAAGNRSYFGIETDVHVTADGKFVLLHDNNTKRVSGGTVKLDVEKSTLAELQNVVLPDLDGSFNRRDLRIPTLTDYIKICKKYEKICVLELKNSFSRENIERVIDQIDTLGYLQNMIFISFNLENCLKVREALSGAVIQWLANGEITPAVINKLVTNRIDLDIEYTWITKEIVDKIHSLGLKVNCWTCDKAADAQKLIELGVDFITTNILE